MRILRTLIVLLILLCLTPPLVLLMAGLVARWAGCEIDPDAPVNCHVFGGDYGDVLYAMTQFGWLAVATLPALAALIVAWLLIEAALAFGRSTNQAIQTPANSRNRVRGS